MRIDPTSNHKVGSRELLKEYNISLPEALLADSRDKAVEASGKVGYPVAMKVVSPDIIHKSDAGGIKLGLGTEEDVSSAFDEIVRNTGTVTTEDRIVGMLISPMVSKGQECIIGMIQDRQFGPVIMFGLGGIFVEVLKDVAFRMAPLTAADAREIIREIKGYQLLEGYRGQAPVAVSYLEELLLKVSGLVIRNPEIKSF